MNAFPRPPAGLDGHRFNESVKAVIKVAAMGARTSPPPVSAPHCKRFMSRSVHHPHPMGEIHQSAPRINGTPATMGPSTVP